MSSFTSKHARVRGVVTRFAVVAIFSSLAFMTLLWALSFAISPFVRSYRYWAALPDGTERSIPVERTGNALDSGLDDLVFHGSGDGTVINARVRTADMKSGAIRIVTRTITRPAGNGPNSNLYPSWPVQAEPWGGKRLGFRSSNSAPAIRSSVRWRESILGFAHASQQRRAESGESYSWDIWNVPLWPAVVGLIGLVLVRGRLLRWRKLYGCGICRSCGYDLRASRERCPECGTAIPDGLDESSQGKKSAC
jgi:hypothetical protein